MSAKPRVAVLKLTCCIDCPHHRVERDPDPYDSFCSDDVKVLCEHPDAPKRAITVACRPYRVREESEVPEWCPLLKKVKR